MVSNLKTTHYSGVLFNTYFNIKGLCTFNVVAYHLDPLIQIQYMRPGTDAACASKLRS